MHVHASATSGLAEAVAGSNCGNGWQLQNSNELRIIIKREKRRPFYHFSTFDQLKFVYRETRWHDHWTDRSIEIVSGD